LYHASAGMLARGSGMGYQAGTRAPTDEHVDVVSALVLLVCVMLLWPC
jgi:hypothetical protein